MSVKVDAAELKRLEDLLSKQRAEAEAIGQAYQELKQHLSDVETRLKALGTAQQDAMKQRLDAQRKALETLGSEYKVLTGNVEKLMVALRKLSETPAAPAVASGSAPGGAPSAPSVPPVPPPGPRAPSAPALPTRAPASTPVPAAPSSAPRPTPRPGPRPAAVLLGGALETIPNGPLIGAIARLGPKAMAAAAAVKVLLGTIQRGADVFNQAEGSVGNLDSALALQGRLSDEYRAKLQALSVEMERTWGSRAQWTNVLTELTQAGAGPKEIEQAAGAVQHLAAVLGGDLTTATAAVSGALKGDFGQLAELGIQFDETATRSEKLAHAYATLGDMGGKIHQGPLARQWSELKSAISDIAVGTGNAIVMFGRWLSTASLLQGTLWLLTKGAEGIASILPKTIAATEGLENQQKGAVDSTKLYEKAMRELREAGDEAAEGQNNFAAASRRSQAELEESLATIEKATQATKELSDAQAEVAMSKVDLAIARGEVSPDEGARQKRAIKREAQEAGLAAEHRELDSSEDKIRKEINQEEANWKQTLAELTRVKNDPSSDASEITKAQTDESQARAKRDFAIEKSRPQLADLYHRRQVLYEHGDALSAQAEAEELQAQKQVKQKERLQSLDMEITAAKSEGRTKDAQHLEITRTWYQEYFNRGNAGVPEWQAQQAANTTSGVGQREVRNQEQLQTMELAINQARAQGDEAGATQLEQDRGWLEKFNGYFASGLGTKEAAGAATDAMVAEARGSIKLHDFGSNVGARSSVATALHYAGMETAAKSDIERTLTTLRSGFDGVQQRLEALIDKITDGGEFR